MARLLHSTIYLKQWITGEWGHRYAQQPIIKVCYMNDICRSNIPLSLHIATLALSPISNPRAGNVLPNNPPSTEVYLMTPYPISDITLVPRIISACQYQRARALRCKLFDQFEANARICTTFYRSEGEATMIRMCYPSSVDKYVPRHRQ